MKPYLELLTPTGQPLIVEGVPAQWPAGMLGEHGWTPGPPLNVRVYNIPPEVDQFVINAEVYDGRVRRSTV